jgi:hypothetical protein
MYVSLNEEEPETIQAEFCYVRKKQVPGKRDETQVLPERTLRGAFFVLPVQRRFGIFSIYFLLFRTRKQTHPFQDRLD